MGGMCEVFCKPRKISLLLDFLEARSEGKPIVQLAEEICFQILLLVCLTHQIWIFPLGRLPSSHLLSVMCGFKNNPNVSAVVAYLGGGKENNKKKLFYLKFFEDLRSHSISNIWRVNTCGSPVRSSAKSISHFQHICYKKRHAIRKYEWNTDTALQMTVYFLHYKCSLMLS